MLQTQTGKVLKCEKERTKRKDKKTTEKDKDSDSSDGREARFRDGDRDTARWE